MQQILHQESYKQLLHLSENLIHSLNDLNMDELQYKVTEYIRKLENQFQMLKSYEVSEQNLNDLKQLLHLHENVTELFNEERKNLLEKLKKFHTGKEMRNTYPGK